MIHKRHVDSDEYYPVWFWSKPDPHKTIIEVTCEEIDFVHEANLRWEYAQRVLGDRAGYPDPGPGKSREELAEELRALGVDIPPTPDDERAKAEQS